LYYRNFLNHFFEIFKVSRLVAFEIETRPETFQTAIHKIGLETSILTETKSQDYITAIQRACRQW